MPLLKICHHLISWLGFEYIFTDLLCAANASFFVMEIQFL